MINHTSGNTVYEFLVESYKSNKRNTSPLKYSEGICSICGSRQMGHTTAILKLFSENVKDSFLITPVINKQVRKEIPNEYWHHVLGTDFIRYMKPDDPRKSLKFVMVDFCGVSDKVRSSIMKDIMDTFKSAEFIFTVQ